MANTLPALATSSEVRCFSVKARFYRSENQQPHSADVERRNTLTFSFYRFALTPQTTTSGLLCATSAFTPVRIPAKASCK